MGSVPDGGGRRLRPRHEETRELRAALFNQFRTRGTYTAMLAQDLGPLWTRARSPGGDNRLFFELRHFAQQADAPGTTEALREYVRELERQVVVTLPLTIDGEPAAWACNYLHAAVEPSSGRGAPLGLPRLAPTPRLVEAQIECAMLLIRVGPDEARVTLLGDDHQRVEGIGWAVSGERGYGDAEWGDLAESACAAIREYVPRMRRSYEDQNLSLPEAGFRWRNAAAQRKQVDDMAALACWLLGGRAPGRAMRERLRKRAEILGMDSPSPRGR